MTARWETELDAISQRKVGAGIAQPLLASLHELIAQSQAGCRILKNIDRTPTPGTTRRSGKHRGKARAESVPSARPPCPKSITAT